MANEENSKLPKPAVEIVVDGNTIVKPGMKVYFHTESGGKPSPNIRAADGQKRTFGLVCTCDYVGKTTGGGSSSGGGGGACTCNKICTCNKVT